MAAVQNNILEARSSPQKNKRLQPIYEVHQELLSKESAIAEAERELASAREDASLGDEKQPHDKVAMSQ